MLAAHDRRAQIAEAAENGAGEGKARGFSLKIHRLSWPTMICIGRPSGATLGSCSRAAIVAAAGQSIGLLAGRPTAVQGARIVSLSAPPLPRGQASGANVLSRESGLVPSGPLLLAEIRVGFGQFVCIAAASV